MTIVNSDPFTQCLRTRWSPKEKYARCFGRCNLRPISSIYGNREHLYLQPCAQHLFRKIVLGGCYTTITANADLDSCNVVGMLYASLGANNTSTLTNKPSDLIGAFYLYVLGLSNTVKTQIIIKQTGDKIYTRSFNNNTWTVWKSVALT